MSVILLILKIIGILLLVVLGLILLVLAAVLLVPVRYQIACEVQEETLLHIRASWLLHLVSVLFSNEEGEYKTVIRIFGIPLGRRKKRQTGTDGADDASEEAADTAKAEGISSAEDTSFAEKTEGQEETEEAEEPEEADEPEWAQNLKEPGTSKDADTSESRKESGIIARIRQFYEKLKASVCGFFAAVVKAKGIITDESNKTVLGSVWSEVWYLLKHFRFRHVEADVTFSLADPATTGQVLGVLCMMPFLYGQKVKIIPDFESENLYLQGSFAVDGRMRGIHVVRSIIRLLRQKEVRDTLKRFHK